MHTTVRLPLGWRYGLSTDLASFPLSSGRTFVAYGDVRQEEAEAGEAFRAFLRQRFPRGYIVKGVPSTPQLSHPAHFCSGYERVLTCRELTTKSLRSLAERARRKVVIELYKAGSLPPEVYRSCKPLLFRAEQQIFRGLFRELEAEASGWMVLRHKESLRVCAALSWSESEHQITHVELMRRAPDAPVGTLELAVLELVSLLPKQWEDYLSLGEVPSFRPRDRDLPTRHPASSIRLGAFELAAYAALRSPLSSWSSEGLATFKGKFAGKWLPLYWVGSEGISMRDLMDISTLTRADHAILGKATPAYRRALETFGKIGA